MTARNVIDGWPGAGILADVSAQIAGILLGVFSVLASAFIIWGAFAEEKRANADRDARVS